MNWINVEDKLPEIGVSVIVECENGDITAAKYIDDYWIDDEYGEEVEVTHWIPMPK